MELLYGIILAISTKANGKMILWYAFYYKLIIFFSQFHWNYAKIILKILLIILSNYVKTNIIMIIYYWGHL